MGEKREHTFKIANRQTVRSINVKNESNMFERHNESCGGFDNHFVY